MMCAVSADDETNVALGRRLRNAGIATYLLAAGLVASGCTDLLLGGSRRIVERGVLAGTHSWASPFGDGDEVPSDDPPHRLYLDYYRDMGIPEAFYRSTLGAAPTDSIHWMTEAEMARYRDFTVIRLADADPVGGRGTRTTSRADSPGRRQPSRMGLLALSGISVHIQRDSTALR